MSYTDSNWAIPTPFKQKSGFTLCRSETGHNFIRTRFAILDFDYYDPAAPMRHKNMAKNPEIRHTKADVLMASRQVTGYPRFIVHTGGGFALFLDCQDSPARLRFEYPHIHRYVDQDYLRMVADTGYYWYRVQGKMADDKKEILGRVGMSYASESFLSLYEHLQKVYGTL